MAAALDLFLIPADIAPGGVSGLAIILSKFVPLPTGTLILIINIPIFIWGLKNFSRRFVAASLFGMVCLSVMTDALSFLRPLTGDYILSSVYGGAVMGLGTGIVLRAGMTTGGTDIAAQILKKHFPDFSVGRFILIIDAFIIVLAGIVYGKWEVVLYSAAALYVSTKIVDIIVEGVDFAKLVYVVSDCSKEISTEISGRLHHGSTALHGSSDYSGKNKTVLMCVVKKYEISKLKKIIYQTDPNAFVVVSEVREVFGNGFKNY